MTLPNRNSENNKMHVRRSYYGYPPANLSNESAAALREILRQQQKRRADRYLRSCKLAGVDPAAAPRHVIEKILASRS